MYDSNCIGRILSTSSPQAIANILGPEKYKTIYGQALFYDLGQGTLIAVSIEGIPMQTASCGQRVLGFHIHEGARCLLCRTSQSRLPKDAYAPAAGAPQAGVQKSKVPWL